MRVIFFGTPGCAVPYLRGIREAGGELVAVVTQPDKPKGRSKALCPPPVKEAAEAENICLLQPDTCRSPEFIDHLRSFEADILLVVAYGRILCPNLLAVPTVAALNVHYSLLPAYRGAAPVQHALLDGLSETGVTLQHLAAELDAGDIVAQDTLTIADDDNTATLTQRLTTLGVELVKSYLPGVHAGTAPRFPQDESAVTLAPRLSKCDGVLDLSQPARVLAGRIRAVTPWPGAVVCLRDKPLIIREATALSLPEQAPAGTIVALDPATGPVVATGDGALLLRLVQPLGRKPMTGAEYLRGARLTLQDVVKSVSNCG
ncbi:MAG: methionyl-tRNA formyltransferase [Armatimonadota bacterium]